MSKTRIRSSKYENNILMDRYFLHMKIFLFYRSTEAFHKSSSVEGAYHRCFIISQCLYGLYSRLPPTVQTEICKLLARLIRFYLNMPLFITLARRVSCFHLLPEWWPRCLRELVHCRPPRVTLLITRWKAWGLIDNSWPVTGTRGLGCSRIRFD